MCSFTGKGEYRNQWECAFIRLCATLLNRKGVALQRVFAGEFDKSLIKSTVVAVLDAVQILVSIKAVMRDFNDGYGNVGAVIGNPLKIGQHIG